MKFRLKPFWMVTQDIPLCFWLQAVDILQKAIALTRQVSYYQDWQKRVVRMVGNERASTIFSEGIHILSAGSSDFLQNYYISPVLNCIYTPSRYSDMLLTSYYTFVQVPLKHWIKLKMNTCCLSACNSFDLEKPST